MSVARLPSRDMIREFALLPADQRNLILNSIPPAMQREMVVRWEAFAHDGQYAPDGDWRVWLIRAGRGFGKTRAGAEWVHQVARANPGARIALVSGTGDDVRRVMVEGASGLLAVAHDDEVVRWSASSGEAHLPGGVVVSTYSAGAPEGLRGPEHHFAWCDELGKWGPSGLAAWDNLAMGLRLGTRPRVMVTTTPRTTPLMRKVLALTDLVQTNGRTHDNPHLPDSFVEAMTAEYAGTRLGRQELDGEMIEDVADALWTRDGIEACRVRRVPELVRIVVAVDPPASATGDACGIVAAGIAADGRGYVIADASVSGCSPETWAAAVAACFERVRADRVVAEKNQGGDMVRSVLLAADHRLPVTLVHASRGKTVRAEPVSALYASGKVSHVGAFPALEDELCGLVRGGVYEGPGQSPDRADALVWALTELMLGRRGRAGVRSV